MVDLAALSAQIVAECVRRGATIRKGEYVFPCPVHSERTPGACSFRPEVGWNCFSCGGEGGVLDMARVLGIDPTGKVDPEALAQFEADRLAIAGQLESEKQLAGMALAEYWQHCQAAAELTRHAETLERLAREGIGRLAVEHFGLGWRSYGIDGVGYPALAIPWTVGGKVRAVQYRILSDDPPGGRYRWHKGSRATIFNADAVVTPQDDMIIVCEGAKKSIALWGAGIVSVCAVANKQSWNPEWSPQFAKFDRVIFALDPDATKEAVEAAKTVPGARVAHMPRKPDDMLRDTRGDVDLLMSYIDQARRVDAGRCR